MRTDLKFHPVMVDDFECVRELKRKLDADLEYTYKTYGEVKDRIRETAQLLSNADLPAGVKIRMSCSQWFELTLVVSNLGSFHDVTEILAVIGKDRSNVYRDQDPTMTDDPAAGTRTFTFKGWFGWRDCYVKCQLGAERDGCKVKTVTIKKMVQTEKPTYTEEEVEETRFVCPGEDGYDDI